METMKIYQGSQADQLKNSKRSKLYSGSSLWVLEFFVYLDMGLGGDWRRIVGVRKATEWMWVGYRIV